MVFFVQLVFLLERNMTNGIVLCGQLLNFLLEAFACILDEFLELRDDGTLLLQVGMFLAACTGILLVAGIEELVAGSQELFPQNVALLARYDTCLLPFLLQ